MSAMSTDRYSTEHTIRTGSCVNNSRPVITRFDGNRNTHYAVNEVNENKISARMALLLKHHEEQRALQRRVWEAERRALEQEKRLIKKKYSLLMEQSSKRRGTSKRSQVANTAVEVHHTTSFDHNELPTDIRAAEAAVGSQRRTSVAVSKQHANQLQMLHTDHTIDSSHTDRIQQRNTSASPQSIPNDDNIINDNGISHADTPARTKPTVVSSTPPVPRSPSSLKTKQMSLNSHNYDHHTTPNLSASEENKCRLSIEAETGCSTDGKLLRAPPNFVAPNVPDPAPPPSRLEEGLTLCKRICDLDLYAKVLKLNGLLCDQLLLKKRNAAYQCRRESDGEYHVRDDDSVGAVSNRRKMKIAGLYHRYSNMQAGSHHRSINISGDTFPRLLDLSNDYLRHETDQHKSICAVLNGSNVLQLHCIVAPIRGKKGIFCFRCHIRRHQPDCSRKCRQRNQVFCYVHVPYHISPRHTLEKKCEFLGICTKHLNGEVEWGMLGNRASPPGIKDKLACAANKSHDLFVYATFYASTLSTMSLVLISTGPGHLLGVGADRMLPRSSNLRTFPNVSTTSLERILGENLDRRSYHNRRAIRRFIIDSICRHGMNEDEQEGDDDRQQYQQRLLNTKHGDGHESRRITASYNCWRDNKNEQLDDRAPQYFTRTIDYWCTSKTRYLGESKTGTTAVASVTGGRMLLATLPAVYHSGRLDMSSAQNDRFWSQCDE